MVVNSNPQHLETMNQYLTQSGYVVLTADSGTTAIAKAQLFTPDLILLETELIDISGYDVCKRIKKNPQTAEILIALLSNLDTPEQATKALQAGADDFLSKTFDATMLITKIKSILRTKHLADQLKAQYAELQKKERIIDYEMKMARQVQRSLIQEFDHSINDVYFFSKYMPAMDIGGDFYEVIPWDSTHIGVIMGDVSGHGISAALLTSMLAQMAKTFAMKNPSPNELLQKMNADFCSIFSKGITDIYACVFCALIDAEEQTITYSNAGLSLPYYVDSVNHSAVELSSSGVPIGLLSESHYTNTTIPYSKGDLLFLQTDGLQDIYYKDKPEEYSLKVREILLEFMTSESAELTDFILNMFFPFEPSQMEKYAIDDVSLLLCRL